jgi:arylsulfatase A-like enzyme
MRPNVLVVVLDTARADSVEPHGAPRGASPAIADLAARGRALADVHAAASWTLPSHAAMFTGLLPRASGIFDLAEGSPRAARPVLEAQAERMLPVVLRGAGYATGAVSTNLWITPESGFAPGFEEFRKVDTGRQAALHREDIRSRWTWNLEGVRARVDDGAAEAGAILRSWLRDRDQGRPFFWFVNLTECHSPYLPPRPYNDLGLRDRWRAAEEARLHLTLGAVWKACAGGFDVPEEALSRMRHLYARSVRLMDDWLADLLGELDDARVLDETLVIVTSDHGENFGEGGLMGHAFSLDDRLLRVPFVAAGPGTPADPGVLTLAALPRLIADAAGLERHPWHNGVPPAGIAVAQFEPPGDPYDPRWDKAFADWGVDPEPARERVGRPLAAATNGRWKLQLRGEHEELFDLEADPLELSPQPANDDPAIAALRGALAEAAAAPVPAVPALTAEPEISDEERIRLEERMKLLGYM